MFNKFYCKEDYIIYQQTYEIAAANMAYNQGGVASTLTSKQKIINQLRFEKFVGFTPAQFLHEDRCAACKKTICYQVNMR